MSALYANVFLRMFTKVLYWLVILLQVGNAEDNTKVANYLLQKYGIYVQAINCPTVAPGEERLRIAPTPFHTPAMMDTFVESLVQSWTDCGLHLDTSAKDSRQPSLMECKFCEEPRPFDMLSQLEREFFLNGIFRPAMASMAE